MTEAKSEQCPTSEELSAFYDAQARGEESEAQFQRVKEHLAGCEKCRKTLDSYGMIDRLMADALAADDGLAERVKARCRAAELQRRWRSIGRVAAVVAVVIGVMAGVWLSERKESGGEIAQATTGDRSDGIATALTETSETPLTNVAKEPPVAPLSDEWLTWHEPTSESVQASLSHNGMSDKDIRTVGMQHGNQRKLGGQGGAAEINDAVRHIWMVDDLAASRELFTTFAKRSGVKTAFADKDGRLIVQFRGLTDRQLQGLVEQLNARKWALVSPMLPQPKQWERVKFTGKPVTYTVWAVEKAKKP